VFNLELIWLYVNLRYIQYMHIVGKYIVYLCKFWKQVEKKASFFGLFIRIQINFLPTMHLYCVYPAISKILNWLPYFTKMNRNRHFSNYFQGYTRWTKQTKIFVYLYWTANVMQDNNATCFEHISSILICSSYIS
jgi:hypothetical protein